MQAEPIGMKIERDDTGVLRIEAEGIEVVVEQEDDTPSILQTFSSNATRKAMREVATALKNPSRWPTRRLPRI